jgi:4-hydroxymandelate oxidase
MLADASNLDLSCELFGEKLAMPILVAPTGAHQLIHPDGEIATMKASCAVKSLMAISTVSSYPFEKIAEAATGPFWFQLYPGPDREGTDERVARVVAGGAKAIVVTTDLPYISHRERLMRNRISGPAPQGLNVPLRRNRIAAESAQPHKYRLQPTYVAQVTWPYISELKSQVKVPVLIKGLMTAEDAELALKHGADGIIVSNHGGRALETAPSTIEVLPEIVGAVKGRVPVLVDGGIRRGTDILKALALGAKAVLVGRAPLWGLGAFGQQGVERVMQILERELALAMGLAGVTSLSRIQSNLVMRSR